MARPRLRRPGPPARGPRRPPLRQGGRPRARGQPRRELRVTALLVGPGAWRSGCQARSHGSPGASLPASRSRAWEVVECVKSAVQLGMTPPSSVSAAVTTGGRRSRGCRGRDASLPPDRPAGRDGVGPSLGRAFDLRAAASARAVEVTALVVARRGFLERLGIGSSPGGRRRSHTRAPTRSRGRRSSASATTDRRPRTTEAG